MDFLTVARTQKRWNPLHDLDRIKSSPIKEKNSSRPQSAESQMDNQIWKFISDPFSKLFQFLSKFWRKRFFEMSWSLMKKTASKIRARKGKRWKKILIFRRAPRAMKLSAPCDEEIMPLTLWVQDSWVLRKDRLDDIRMIRRIGIHQDVITTGDVSITKHQAQENYEFSWNQGNLS